MQAEIETDLESWFSSLFLPARFQEDAWPFCFAEGKFNAFCRTWKATLHKASAIK